MLVQGPHLQLCVRGVLSQRMQDFSQLRGADEAVAVRVVQVEGLHQPGDVVLPDALGSHGAVRPGVRRVAHRATKLAVLG